MDAVCVRLPPVALKATVYEPGGNCVLALIVRVAVPEPGAAMVVLDHAAVKPGGRLVVAKVTAELKPPLAAAATVIAALAPGAIVADVGAALNCSAGADVVASLQCVTSRLASTEPSPVTAS